MDLASKRVCVTGGAGFLGSFLVQRLKAHGVRDVLAVGPARSVHGHLGRTNWEHRRRIRVLARIPPRQHGSVCCDQRCAQDFDLHLDHAPTAQLHARILAQLRTQGAKDQAQGKLALVSQGQ